MTSVTRILHMEDDALDAELVLRRLQEDGLIVEINRVETMEQFTAALERESYALILADYSLPGVDPLEVLHHARARYPATPFIFVSGAVGEERAIETLKLGATDYVLKQRMGRLVPAVRRALDEAREQSRCRAAETALRENEQRLRQLNEELEARVRRRTAELEAANEALTAEIHERRRIEDELRRSNDDLESFAYISSHDLQEPLRMIGSYVGLLVLNYKEKLDEDARTFIGYAEEGAIRMSNLIKALLEYSRVNSRGHELAPTDVRTVIEQVLENLRLKIEETGARVIYGENLPTIMADRAQLSQVFQNLIENALKFRRDNEPPIIRIFADASDRRWVFCIHDNGIGIDPAHLDQIFVPFKRLHANRMKYPGMGIGLAVVKRVVERHGGQICVESKPDQGTTFYFTLPE